MAIGSISVIPGNMQSLYKTLGFNDKNKNGVIEENADEGYFDLADINKDGKIVEAEMKFRWLKLTKDFPGSDPFPLTVADREILAVCFKEAMAKARILKYNVKYMGDKHPDPLYELKAIDIKYLALDMAVAGMDKSDIENAFAEALETIRHIEKPSQRAKEMASCAKIMAKAGQEGTNIENVFKEALSLTDTPPLYPGDNPSFGIVDNWEALECKAAKLNVIAEMAEAGLFEMAKATLGSIKEDSYDRSEVIKVLAIYLAKAGSFQDALETARSIKETFLKETALREIAVEMIQAGAYKEAYKTIDPIETSETKISAIDMVTLKLIEAIAAARQNTAEGKAEKEKDYNYNVLKEVIRTLSTIESSKMKNAVLNVLVSKMLAYGMKEKEINRAFQETGIERPK